LATAGAALLAKKAKKEKKAREKAAKKEKKAAKKEKKAAKKEKKAAKKEKKVTKKEKRKRSTSDSSGDTPAASGAGADGDAAINGESSAAASPAVAKPSSKRARTATSSGDEPVAAENPPVESFDICSATVRALAERGIKTLFPIQVQTFDALHKGKDLIGRARTGMGKTLAFALPLIERLLARPGTPRPSFLSVGQCCGCASSS
jgi:ATP-dependent RNA helicase DDX21